MIPRSETGLSPTAIQLCKILHLALEPYGFFIALTGGTLYKEGRRKDIDLILYKKRESMPREHDEVIDLRHVFNSVGVNIIESYGFCTKARWEGIDIDILYPESTSHDKYKDEPSDYEIQSIGSSYRPLFPVGGVV